MAQLRRHDIVVFDELPDEVPFDQIGAVNVVLNDEVHVRLLQHVTDKPPLPVMLVFERDDSSHNGLLSWDKTGQWKVSSVWRP